MLQFQVGAELAVDIALAEFHTAPVHKFPEIGGFDGPRCEE
jgi:hypothetical protein